MLPRREFRVAYFGASILLGVVGCSNQLPASGPVIPTSTVDMIAYCSIQGPSKDECEWLVEKLTRTPRAFANNDEIEDYLFLDGEQAFRIREDIDRTAEAEYLDFQETQAAQILPHLTAEASDYATMVSEDATYYAIYE